MVFGILNGTVGRWCWFDGVWVVGWSEIVVGEEGVGFKGVAKSVGQMVILMVSLIPAVEAGRREVGWLVCPSE